MQELAAIDWVKLFAIDTPVVEILIRGTVMYVALFVLMRFVLKREAGALGIADLLVLVLLADAAQNAMADDYSSITDGLILVGTIVFWSRALNWLGYHFPPFQRFLRPAPLPLVHNGRVVIDNMRRELITRGELMSMLRQQGIDDVKEVKSAFMEGDGRISVICREVQTRPQGTPERQVT